MFEYAKKELSLIKKDEYGAQKFINESVLEIVKIFSEHSKKLLKQALEKEMQRLSSYVPQGKEKGEGE